MMRTKKKTWVKPIAQHVDAGAFKRFVGTYDPNKNCYIKHVRESEHLFRKLDAWGIDAEIFNKIIKAKSANIEVHDKETGRVYIVSARVFAEYGRYFHFKHGDISHQVQIFLPRAYWTRTPDMTGTSAPIVDPTTILEGESIRETIDQEEDYAEAQKRVDKLFDSV